MVSELTEAGECEEIQSRSKKFFPGPLGGRKKAGKVKANGKCRISK